MFGARPGRTSTSPRNSQPPNFPAPGHHSQPQQQQLLKKQLQTSPRSDAGSATGQMTARGERRRYTSDEAGLSAATAYMGPSAVVKDGLLAL